MPLLIDCYNVLHETMPPVLAGLDEAGLCVAVSRTAWAGRGVTVVADGRPKPLRATRSPVDGVELVFAGASRTADDVMIQMIDASSAPRRLTVVSTDREIRAAARRRKARSLTSEQFINKLTRAVVRGGPSKPRKPAKPDPGKLPPEIVDQWLIAFGYTPGADPGADPAAPRSRPPEDPPDNEDEDLTSIWPPW